LLLLIQSKQELLQQILAWRQNGERIAVVPTMGNLHAGHLSLVSAAQESADRVVVTSFVNPMQFGEGDDFEQYPRTLDDDVRCLEESGVDLLFAPDVATVYPFGIENATLVIVPGLTENFCGSFRPGHFDGVTSIVARLFALVQADSAVFGQKDFQQQLVIRRMVNDLNLPIEIVTAPTVREADGLAMSSRNVYLSKDERQVAPLLYQVICDVAESVLLKQETHSTLEDAATSKLRDAGFVPEYLAVRAASDLSIPEIDCDDLVVLVAAQLGKTRLIDNVLIGRTDHDSNMGPPD
jgi:pantoate--beta-alanine ligase